MSAFDPLRTLAQGLVSRPSTGEPRNGLMVRRTAFFIGSLAALVGCVALNEADMTTFEGASYRLVKGEELRSAFAGNKIRYLDGARSS